MVREVERNSPEAAAGFRKGDVIVAVNGEPAFSAAQAQGMLGSGSGARVVVEVRRDGRPKRLELPRPDPGLH